MTRYNARTIADEIVSSWPGPESYRLTLLHGVTDADLQHAAELIKASDVKCDVDDVAKAIRDISKRIVAEVWGV